MEIKAPEILANTDYTWEFRKHCIWRSPGVLLKPATAYKVFTHKLIIDWQGVRLKALIQVNGDCKQILFLN